MNHEDGQERTQYKEDQEAQERRARAHVQVREGEEVMEISEPLLKKMRMTFRNMLEVAGILKTGRLTLETREHDTEWVDLVIEIRPKTMNWLEAMKLVEGQITLSNLPSEEPPAPIEELNKKTTGPVIYEIAGQCSICGRVAPAHLLEPSYETGKSICMACVDEKRRALASLAKVEENRKSISRRDFKRLIDYRDGRKESYDRYEPLDSQERHDKDELAAFINGLDKAIEILTEEKTGGVIKIPKARHMIPCKNHALDSTIISNQEDQEVERNKVVKALQGILIIMSKNHTQKCQKIQDYQKSIGELQDWIREYIGGIDED